MTKVRLLEGGLPMGAHLVCQYDVPASNDPSSTRHQIRPSMLELLPRVLPVPRKHLPQVMA